MVVGHLFKKYFSIFKSIRFLNSKNHADIIIWNTFNSEYIINSLNKKYSTSVVEFSNQNIYLFKSFHFFYLFIYNIFKHFNINYAYSLAVILFIKPKIIITYLSNSPFPKNLPELNKKIKFISIQYAPESPDNALKKYYYYFSWGSMSEKLFNKYGIEYKKIFTIGSLKLATFLEKYPSCEFKINNQIAFISTYRRMYHKMDFSNYSDLEKDTLYDITYCLNRLLIKTENLLKKLCERNFEVSVALANSEKTIIEKNCEIEYFSNISNKLQLVPKNNLSSYKLCCESKITLTLNSSLGFELIAIGKKVIFLINEDEFLKISQKPWGDENLLYKNIPPFLRSSFSIDELLLKIEYLNNLSLNEYIDLIKEFREFYCVNSNKTIENFNNYINEILMT